MKIGNKLKNLIGAVAPTLGTALGGPFGAIAGNAIREALGVDSETAALKLIESNPDSLLKLKQAEHDFEKRLAELDVDLEKINAGDRADARQMAASTSIAPQAVITCLFVCGYFTIIGLFFSETLVVPQNDAFYLLVGVMTAAIPQILNFWFGSSVGSKMKTAVMANAGGSR